MITLTDESSTPLRDEQRLLPFGLWLRRTSVDELLTLWNVLCGHMSLVGPRPLLVQYLPLCSRPRARRHEVRLGITGLAQMNGRNIFPGNDTTLHLKHWMSIFMAIGSLADSNMW